MGKSIRILIISLSLIAIVAVLVAGLSIGLFLQALRAFTQETVVAEVIMSPIQQDENGEYIEIVFTPYVKPDALESALRPAVAGLANYGQPQTYKIYGDTVAIRGPFIKLHNGLLFLSFQNVYKLALIEGEYRRQNNPNAAEGTEIYINGGFDESWWLTNNNEAAFPYNLVIDRFTFSGDEEPGFYGTGRKRYDIVVTNDTLTWNLIGIFAD